MTWMRFRKRAILALSAAAAVLACVLVAQAGLGALDRMPVRERAERIDLSQSVLDRDGRLLRAFATADGRWRLPVGIDEVDPLLVRMLLAYEDKRFFEHRGVDPAALLRAAGQAIAAGHVVSGGSTLTMQVARLLEPRADGRTLRAKLSGIAAALALERHLSKPEILRLYFTLAPYGGNIEGLRAASLAYFGREPRRLTVAEAALLVALPQSPEARRPDRSPDTARAARGRVLDRLAAGGIVAPAEAIAARQEAVPRARQAFPMLAAHIARELAVASPGAPVLRTALDRTLQASLERLAKERAVAEGAKMSVAILVAAVGSGEVRAHVGSPDPLDDRRAGFIDMTNRLRSPGSALKPFIYGLAFEAGLLHPETLMQDRPTTFGTYAPNNFDEAFHGTVSARRALQLSLNIPAVAALQAVTPQRLVARMGLVGTPIRLPAGEPPSLPIALGGAGITLRDLVRAYGGLANGGTVVPLSWLAADGPRREAGDRRLLDRAAAWYVGDILSGTLPPDNALSGQIAFKTGTSYGYRDAWALGFDGGHVVGVWVGRPDGAASSGLVGRAAAAPILFDVFSRLEHKPLATAPPGVLLARNAELPLPLRMFDPEAVTRLPAQSQRSAAPLAIAFPPDGVRLDLDDGHGGRGPLALKAAGGTLPLTWLVNGMPIAGGFDRRQALWQPDGPGFTRVSVVDAQGRSASAAVRID